MEPRYYLTLVFEDGKKDKLVPFGENRAAASDALTDMIQNGGPEGIVRAVFFSTKKLVKTTELHSKSWFKAQTESVLRRQQTEQETISEAQRAAVLDRFEAVKSDAAQLGVELPVQAPAVVVGPDGQPISPEAPPAP